MTNNSNITTHGNDAHAIYAESAGGGGSGGFSIAVAGADSFAASLSIGGKGGAGGAGDAVDLDNHGAALTTHGDRSHGILAQSLGGGGGNGGFAVSGAITVGPGVAFGLSVGGSGETGGRARSVTLDSTSNVDTHGDDAAGIFAQSLGGGGGNGGFSVSGGLSGAVAANISVGGSGAKGGSAGTVTVGEETFTSGTIHTRGDKSVGLVAQSIGGGGGAGGFSVSGGGGFAGASANLSIGGAGGDGRDGDAVKVQSASTVITEGDEAPGLFVQSLGGGGGKGGFSVVGGFSAGGTIGATIGGSGGDGGSAGNVDVTCQGAITTSGWRSYGLQAQSVDGGGGDGGFSIAGGISQVGSATFSLGGGGGPSGVGRDVAVTSLSKITTQGDETHGLFAQSVSKGGGAGGFSVAGGLSQGGALSASLGGTGGAGGDSGRVFVTTTGENTGYIYTRGDKASGIFAQSVGGGGGSGGFSVAASISQGPAVNFSMGGSGGQGGLARDVILNSSGSISTAGMDAHAIFAQSVGGGGGSGGFSVAASLSSDQDTGAISASIGGSGTGGGNGGNVTLGTFEPIDGQLSTWGARAHGIFAQSVGGGGGTGGFSVGTFIGKGDGLSFSLGGSGDKGGDAGLVTVHSASSIATYGADAYGLLVQSLGGGGGSGGFSVAGNVSLEARAVGVSIGGSGGPGGNASTVSATSRGADIVTWGERAYGFLAQSLGGGGGDGAFSVAGSLTKKSGAVNVSVGGGGGIAGFAGTTSVNSASNITTHGSDAHAIKAQSIGGGGGSGGFSVAGALSWAESADAKSGAVDVMNSGRIATFGTSSAGVFAESIGGGGGDGGFSVAGSLSKPPSGELPKGPRNINVAVGGTGGSGNAGANVNVGNTGSIDTFGTESHGVLAHSVGGGGGKGGFAAAGSLGINTTATEGSRAVIAVGVGGFGGSANVGGDVTVDNAHAITTRGEKSRGIYAYSVGGGGGHGGASFAIDTLLGKPHEGNGLNVEVAVGGGTGNDGGDVSVDNHGGIVTVGARADAIYAQSIGGGGGEAQNFATGTGAGSSVSTGIQGKFALGGGGGAAGNGGNVEITNIGTLVTLGEDAHGIFAQSIGGGGGVAGSVDRWLKDPIGPIPALNLGVGLAFGQDGGNAGDGGAVTIINDGDIYTHGVGAFGVFAQSIGGGGGVAGGLGNTGTFLAPILSLQNFAGSTGGDGSAGAVRIEQTGNITVFGDHADAILAQSTATKGFGGDVSIDVNGHIDAGGANANGIRAQSYGELGSGDIAITLTGSVRGGTQAGAAVNFNGGQNNSLINRGSMGRLDELGRFAIAGGNGNEAIRNFGVLAGNVSLGSGSNQLSNEASGLLVSGASLDLGTHGLAQNHGKWSVGSPFAIASTSVGGMLEQTGTGQLLMDYDHAALSADRLDISESARLSGEIVLNQMHLASMQPGFTQVVLASAAGGMDTSDLTLQMPASVIMQSALSVSGHDLVLSLAKDFAPLGLNDLRFAPSTLAVGQYMNRVQTAGSSVAMAPIVAALVGFDRVADLAQAYQQMSPLGYTALAVSQLHSGLRFNEALASCKSREGGYQSTSEGACGWMAMVGQREDHEAKPTAIGFSASSNVHGGNIKLSWPLRTR